MNTQTNHPLPTIHGVSLDRRHYEGTCFEYRGKTFCLTLSEFVDENGGDEGDRDGFVAVEYWETDPHREVRIELEPENDSDCLHLSSEEIAKSGFNKAQFEPEFVKELCQRIDAALAKEGVPVTNHPLPTIPVLASISLADDANQSVAHRGFFTYRGGPLLLILYVLPKGDGAVEIFAPTGEGQEWFNIDLMGTEDPWLLSAEEVAKTGHDRAEFDPEFVKLVCRRADPIMDAVFKAVRVQ